MSLSAYNRRVKRKDIIGQIDLEVRQIEKTGRPSSKFALLALLLLIRRTFEDGAIDGVEGEES